jgi:hypothetical protein
MRIVGAALALLLGTPLLLFGIILILYQGDAGAEGDVTVDFGGGPKIDADLVGLMLLIVGTALVLFAIWAFRSHVR